MSTSQPVVKRPIAGCFNNIDEDMVYSNKIADRQFMMTQPPRYTDDALLSSQIETSSRLFGLGEYRTHNGKFCFNGRR